jgi:hypothetical protein
MPEFFDRSFPIARKQHKCCECRQPILPGEKYCRNAGKWDGAMDCYKVHVECEELRAELQAASGDSCECIPFGGLAEEIDNIFDPALKLQWWLAAKDAQWERLSQRSRDAEDARNAAEAKLQAQEELQNKWCPVCSRNFKVCRSQTVCPVCDKDVLQ